MSRNWETYNRGVPADTGYLLMLLGTMVVLSIIGSALLVPVTELLRIGEPVVALSVQLVVNAVLVFVIPAWLVEYYHRRKYDTYIYRVRGVNVSKSTYALVPILYTCTVMVVSLLTLLMRTLPLSFFQQKLGLVDSTVQEILQQLFLSRQPLPIALNILGAVLLTPIGEELFFRGALQGWLLSRLRNSHLVVWLVALIFSVAHMHVEGILARWFLGAVLGYVALYGGLKPAILLHMLNNLFALGYLYWYGTSFVVVPNGTGEWVVNVVVSLISLIGVVYIILKIKNNYENKLA